MHYEIVLKAYNLFITLLLDRICGEMEEAFLTILNLKRRHIQMVDKGVCVPFVGRAGATEETKNTIL